MMAGYRYYPEVGDPEDELDKAPSLLEVAAAGGATGGASDAPTTIASPGNVGGATTTSSPMALGDDFQYSEPVGGGIAGGSAMSPTSGTIEGALALPRRQATRIYMISQIRQEQPMRQICQPSWKILRCISSSSQQKRI